jgi:choline dehydrogenase
MGMLVGSSLPMSGSFDFIIVGAGSAGCVLAARLSEEPSVRVLLLEAGTAREPLASRIPAAFSRLFRSPHDWALYSEPEHALGQRRLYVPRGKMLGGSSAMNAMIYVRGNPLDYDRWAALGAAGWSYADVLPYFVRAEDQARGASPVHGVGGPLRVEDLICVNPLSSAFVAACEEVGISRNADFNSGSQDGAGFYQVTQKSGRRWSAANAYLFPVLDRPNLSIKRGVFAARIALEKGRARGIEYIEAGQRKVSYADRDVVLAAGAIGSPQLLLLSGIGPADELARHGIAVQAALGGVGRNLQDHPFAGIAYQCKQPISLLNAETIGALVRYVFARSGPLTSNVAEAGAFVRSSPGLEAPDIQFHFAPVFFLEHGFRRPKGHGFSVGPTLVSPTSRGTLRLRSSDPAAPPILTVNALSQPTEMTALVAGLRLARDIAHAAPFDPFRGAEVFPGDGATSDADLEAHVRATAELLYHPCGTCKMGSDQLSVVDHQLRVRGVGALRIADASVMPVITRGNTNAPTIMIAERLAALLGASVKTGESGAG